MIDRRQALLGGLALTAASGLAPGAALALPIPPGNRLSFDILRKGSKLGTHVISFAPSGDRLTVRVDVRLAYKLLGVTLYQYTHNCTEVWEGGQVVSVESRTNDNGKPHHVSASRIPAGLAVQGSGVPRYIAPADALPATHWNPRQLEGPWINTQDGKLTRLRTTPRGTETIALSGGRTTSARCYDVSGEVTLSTWYDRIGWAGLAFTMKGSPIRYVRNA